MPSFFFLLFFFKLPRFTCSFHCQLISCFGSVKPCKAEPWVYFCWDRGSQALLDLKRNLEERKESHLTDCSHVKTEIFNGMLWQDTLQVYLTIQFPYCTYVDQVVLFCICKIFVLCTDKNIGYSFHSQILSPSYLLCSLTTLF